MLISRYPRAILNDEKNRKKQFSTLISVCETEGRWGREKTRFETRVIVTRVKNESKGRKGRTRSEEGKSGEGLKHQNAT